MGKPPVSLFERASGYVKSTPLFLTILGQLQWLIPPFPVDQAQAQSGLVALLSCLCSLSMLFNV